MYKIAVLGDRESVMGFKALGLEVITAETVEEARRDLHAMAKDPEYAIIYLTEQLAEELCRLIDRGAFFTLEDGNFIKPILYYALELGLRSLLLSTREDRANSTDGNTLHKLLVREVIEHLII